jgi:hypothetical protein
MRAGSLVKARSVQQTESLYQVYSREISDYSYSWTGHKPSWGLLDLAPIDRSSLCLSYNIYRDLER